MAGLIEYLGKELIKITERGKQLLAEEPSRLNIQSLRKALVTMMKKLNLLIQGKAMI